MPYQFGDGVRSLFGYENESGWDLREEWDKRNEGFFKQIVGSDSVCFFNPHWRGSE